jgi:putative nucleotidyltransferase with HDIG domain
LARAIDAKSPWTSGHSERVTEMAMKIGGQMGLSATEMNTLRRGGLLHDIGKIGVRSNILDKPSHLTDPELTQMRDHVRIGATILEPLPGFADVLPIVTEHHEWFNGEGYPRGLKGEEISLGARIFAVADVFDALTSPRPYRQGISRSEVMQHIRERAGRQFDPDVVAAFLKVTVAERNGLRVVHDADAHVAS